jgi:hypothetical protein
MRRQVKLVGFWAPRVIPLWPAISELSRRNAEMGGGGVACLEQVVGSGHYFHESKVRA